MGQVDNFGLLGTAALLGRLGILRTTGIKFEARAKQRLCAEEINRQEDWRRQRFFFKERVYCYAEFALEHPSLPDSRMLQGSLLKENSFLGEGTRAGRTGLLRSTALPINELVDRTLCAEFQALSELCDVVDSAGVTGRSARRFV